MNEITFLIKGILLAYFITRFEPLHWIIDEIKDTKYKLFNIIIGIIKLILTCSRCAALWLTLIISRDPYISIVASFVMVLIEKYILSYVEQIEFKHND